MIEGLTDGFERRGRAGGLMGQGSGLDGLWR